jgi:hypothetical protein
VGSWSVIIDQIKKKRNNYVKLRRLLSLFNSRVWNHLTLLSPSPTPDTFIVHALTHLLCMQGMHSLLAEKADLPINHKLASQPVKLLQEASLMHFAQNTYSPNRPFHAIGDRLQGHFRHNA